MNNQTIEQEAAHTSSWRTSLQAEYLSAQAYLEWVIARQSEPEEYL